MALPFRSLAQAAAEAPPLPLRTMVAAAARKPASYPPNFPTRATQAVGPQIRTDQIELPRASSNQTTVGIPPVRVTPGARPALGDSTPGWSTDIQNPPDLVPQSAPNRTIQELQGVPTFLQAPLPGQYRSADATFRPLRRTYTPGEGYSQVYRVGDKTYQLPKDPSQMAESASQVSRGAFKPTTRMQELAGMAERAASENRQLRNAQLGRTTLSALGGAGTGAWITMGQEREQAAQSQQESLLGAQQWEQRLAQSRARPAEPTQPSYAGPDLTGISGQAPLYAGPDQVDPSDQTPARLMTSQDGSPSWLANQFPQYVR